MPATHATASKKSTRPPKRETASASGGSPVEAFILEPAFGACPCGGGCPRCEAASSELMGDSGQHEGSPPPAQPPADATKAAPPADGTAGTPADTTAASGKCPPFPAPGFEAIVSPRDKIDTRKPYGSADFHAGDGELNVGIGEKLDLSYHSTSGTGKPGQDASNPTFFGGLHWVVSKDPQNLSADPTNGTGTWSAPEAKDDVVLTLFTVAQQCKMAAVKIHVLEPNGIKMDQTGQYWKDATNKVSAGMLVRVVILPADVSFAAVQVQEGDAVVKGHGWWKFADGLHHCKGSGAGKYAGQNSCTLQNVVANKAKGTMLKTGDKIYSGTSNWKKEWLTDPSVSAAERKRLEENDLGTYDDPADGGYTWDIPWLFVIGKAGAKQFAIVQMEAKSNKAGDATISKDDSGPHTGKFTDPGTPVPVLPPVQ